MTRARGMGFGIENPEEFARNVPKLRKTSSSQGKFSHDGLWAASSSTLGYCVRE